MLKKQQGNAVLLSEVEAKKLLDQGGIPVIDTRLARNRQEAASLSREIGFPMVLKIASPDVVHKSDVGGIKIGLTNTTQVSKAYSEIVSNIRQALPDARIDGIPMQKMVQPGVKVIVGMSEDSQFGPVIIFGLGGIWGLLKMFLSVLSPSAPGVPLRWYVK